jgi:hypothetical protein
MKRCEISAEIPGYGCVGCLAAVYERRCRVPEGVSDSWEIVFADDRGRDGAWGALEDIARRDHSVHALRSSRNFSQRRETGKPS